MAPYPKDDLASGEWPDGPLKQGAAPETVLIHHVCRTLKRIRDDRGLSTRQFAKEAKIPYATMQDLLTGKSWGTLRTIAAAEENLGVGLWPAEGTLLLEPGPNRYLLPQGVWPDGPFQSRVPPEVALAKTICTRIRSACEPLDLTVDYLARASGLPLVVLTEILNGDRWPQLSTISRLERGLNWSLWVRPEIDRSKRRTRPKRV